VKKLLFAVVVLVLAWFFATPYLTFRSLKSAAEARDAAALMRHIDFPALKQSLRSNLRLKLTESLGQMHNDNPYGNVLGAAGAEQLVKFADPLLDAAITPEVVTALMQGNTGKANPDKKGGSLATPFEQLSGVRSTEGEMVWSARYQDFDTFALTLRQKESDKEWVTFLMKRHGLASWKVSGVRFP